MSTSMSWGDIMWDVEGLTRWRRVGKVSLTHLITRWGGSKCREWTWYHEMRRMRCISWPIPTWGEERFCSWVCEVHQPQINLQEGRRMDPMTFIPHTINNTITRKRWTWFIWGGGWTMGIIPKAERQTPKPFTPSPTSLEDPVTPLNLLSLSSLLSLNPLKTSYHTFYFTNQENESKKRKKMEKLGRWFKCSLQDERGETETVIRVVRLSLDI